MPIHVLPPDLAAKIAAGEVIERPVSVVKELLENAIDAGADDIQVEIAQGGRRLIRVGDNGCGIPAAEAELAFARHATSKLNSADDLYRLRTLGFRGEALASIAAVAQVTLSTRAAQDEAGTLLRLEAGTVVQRTSQGRPLGTSVLVENLFYNMPARLKFLRADPTEATHVARLLTSYALAYPDKRFTLQHNDRLMLRTLGTGKLVDVLVAIYGLDVAEQMIVLEPPADDAVIRVTGYVGAPSLQRGDRQDLIFFVNRRWIMDNALAYAVAEAYRSLLPQGRHPMVVLNIDLPPEEVDVNIHPTKREVRFRQSRDVFSAVQRAVRTTLMSQYPVPEVGPAATGTPLPWARPSAPGPSGPSLEQSRLALELGRPGAAPTHGESTPLVTETVSTGRLPMLRVLGQVGQTYIIAEGPGGLYLIDQHAAHERIRYEELRNQHVRRAVITQELLDPLPVEVSPQQASLLEAHLADLAAYGLDVAPFGGQTYLVRRIPASLVGGDVSAALAELLDAALHGGPGFSWEEQALITLACHSAVRAGQTLSPDEMRDLVRQLERCELPHTCPHGRPTIVHLSQERLEREFGRR